MISIALIAIVFLSAEPSQPQPESAPVVTWKGTPVGLRRASGPALLDLAPDGRSFIYVQGNPWPRVVLQRIAPAGGAPEEAIVLGDVEPFGDRAPRFDLEGRGVFFTGDFTPRPAAAARPFTRGISASVRRDSPGESLRLAVVRARPADRSIERILPGPGRALAGIAVFLDIHPGGRTILVGTGSELKPHEVPAGSFSLGIEEVDLREDGAPAGPPRPLGFSVNGMAAIRYSWDGAAILHGVAAAGRPGTAMRFDRSSGVQEDLPIEGDRLGWLAGDLEVYPVLLPHPGSFGWDGFPTYLLARRLEGPAVPFSLDEPLAPLPPAPACFRGNRVLLAGGFEDRKVLATAAWDPGSFDRRAAAGAAGPLAPGLGAILPGFSLDAVRARAEDPKAAALLERLRATLAPEAGPPVVAARARWIQAAATGGPSGEIRIEAIETVAGALSIRRSRPSEDPEASGPVEEEIGWDGEDGWFIDGGGRTSASTREVTLIEGAICSPLRLLVDPAGLGFPWLEFRHVEDEADGRGALLEIRSADGWRASLRVSIDGSRVLPVRIESPILFPASETPRELGLTTTEKSVTFEGWGSAAGRLVPGKILFDDGIAPFAMDLVDLEINPEVPARLSTKK